MTSQCSPVGNFHLLCTCWTLGPCWDSRCVCSMQHPNVQHHCMLHPNMQHPTAQHSAASPQLSVMFCVIQAFLW